MTNLKAIEEWRKVIEGRDFTKEEARKHYDAIRKESETAKRNRFDQREE